MSDTQVLFYREVDGTAPVYEWLETLKRMDRNGYAACVAKIRLLAAMGLRARRPTVEYLRDGIFELRARKDGIQYRILYFFHKSDAVVLSHAIVKKTGKVPNQDIDLAKLRKEEFEADREAHTYEEQEDH